VQPCTTRRPSNHTLIAQFHPSVYRPAAGGCFRLQQSGAHHEEPVSKAAVPVAALSAPGQLGPGSQPPRGGGHQDAPLACHDSDPGGNHPGVLAFLLVSVTRSCPKAIPLGILNAPEGISRWGDVPRMATSCLSPLHNLLLCIPA
jgi:hypothetical protein